MQIPLATEDAEVGSVMEFADKLFLTELKLTNNVDLQIQCTHRALALKPSPRSPPRSIGTALRRSVSKTAGDRKLQMEGLLY